MKNSAIRLFHAVLALIVFAAAPLRATDATYNNLTVTGTGDFQGNSVMFGSWISGTNNNPGLTLNYANSGTGTLDFIVGGTSAIWQWWTYNGTQDLHVMKLDQGNKLMLYVSGTSGTVGITLNPLGTGTSTFAGSVVISGSDNELPNQVLINCSSILTEGLADGRYAPASNFIVSSGTDGSGDVGLSIALGSGSATGPYSFAGPGATAAGKSATAIGNGATASDESDLAVGDNTTANGGNASGFGHYASAVGFDSSAIGDYAYASGNFSVAVGESTAYGLRTIAFGEGAQANGDDSGAIGEDTSAYADDSIALGNNASTYGNQSTAVGNYATGFGDQSTALGYNAYANGDQSNAVGIYANANVDYSAALGYYSNANGLYSTAASPFTSADSYAQFVIGQYNVVQGSGTNWVPTDNLFTIGNGADGTHLSNAFVVNKNGDTAVSGAFVVSGTTGNTSKLNGTTQVNGSLVVSGTSVPVVVGSGTVNTVVSTGSNNLMLVPQQGDLSMGEFVAGQQPPTAP